jgi:hypothetical protein
MGAERVAVAVITVGIVGAVAAGCGGSSTTTTQPQTVANEQQGSAPTKAAYIKEVDAICAGYRPQGQGLALEIQKIGQPQTNAQLHNLADLYRQAADVAKAEGQQIRSVTPPTGDESIINKWISTRDTGISLLRDFAGAVDAKGTNGSQLRTLAKEVSSNTDKSKAIAQGYGFTVCGSATG